MLRPKIIVFTGPESSGKSYLAKKMAKEFNLPLVDEFARAYIDELERPYVQSDLLEIAKGQYESVPKFSKENHWLIMDTDGLTIKIWSEEKYNSVDPAILGLLEMHPVNHYLLCSPDIPWVSDPQRENPTDRDRLFNIYQEELTSRKENFTIIEGAFLDRIKVVNRIFQKLISEL